MNFRKYNSIPMGIGSALARNPEARMNFALASQEEQKALIDSCTKCNSLDEMCDLVNSHTTEKKLQNSKAVHKNFNPNFDYQGHPYSF